MRRLSAIDLFDLVRATAELAIARRRLATLTPAELLALAYDHSAAKERRDRTTISSQTRRVGLAIGRMSSRVPWRATCLVQALAAKKWLARHGIESSLFVGVRKDATQALEAHAWLVCNGEVVTGGDVGGFRELLSPDVIDSLKQAGGLSSSATHARTTG